MPQPSERGLVLAGRPSFTRAPPPSRSYSSRARSSITAMGASDITDRGGRVCRSNGGMPSTAVRTPQVSSRARRRVPPPEESQRYVLPGWNGGQSSLCPPDERRRNVVTHDHHAQGAIVVKERRSARAGRLEGGVTGRRGGESGRRSASHRSYQSEHVVAVRRQCRVDQGAALSRIAQPESACRSCAARRVAQPSRYCARGARRVRWVADI